MNERSANSVPDSAATWKTRRPPKSERELLIRQAEAAKSALSKTARKTAGYVFSLLDPRPWVLRHPWESTGLAAVGGFLAASREKNPSKQPPQKHEAVPAPSSTLFGILLAAGAEILKNALTPVVEAEIHERLRSKSRKSP